MENTCTKKYIERSLTPYSSALDIDSTDLEYDPETLSIEFYVLDGISDSEATDDGLVEGFEVTNLEEFAA